MGIFDMIGSFLQPEKAYGAAQRAADRGYNKSQDLLRPYDQGGREQYGRLNEATGQLLDPEHLLGKWTEGYEQSPWAQRLNQMNLQQGQEAASSMGLNGSSGALANIQQGAGDITAKDRQQYIDNLMKQYMAGIGLGENLYGTGANAAGAMSRGALEHGQDIGALAYGKQAAPGHLFEKLLSTAVNGAASFASGGASSIGGANMFNH